MKITVSAIQFKPRAGDIGFNLKKIRDLAEKAVSEGAGLIVLPEICDIGYDLKLIKELAEGFPNQSTETILELAAKHGVSIVAGLAERRKEGIFNTAVIYNGEGREIAKYDKTHLCAIPPINEPALFCQGSSLVITEVEEVKIGITICFDIRFPEIYRKLALSGAEMIVHPTAFPKSRIEQMEICARARTIENQFFAVAANSCGTVGGIELGGRSMIAGPEGMILAKASDDKEEIITASIDLSLIEKTRKERPVLSRRRPELY